MCSEVGGDVNNFFLNADTSNTLLLEIQSVDQQHLQHGHHLGACQKCRISGPSLFY